MLTQDEHVATGGNNPLLSLDREIYSDFLLQQNVAQPDIHLDLHLKFSSIFKLLSLNITN